MTTLSTALKTATTGSRELDAMVARIDPRFGVNDDGVLFRIGPDGPIYGGLGEYVITIPYSTDLIACVALVQEKLPGWWWAVGRNGGDSFCIATVSDDGKTNQFFGEGPTPCLALLRALDAALREMER